jgi:hypothetical protein
MAPIAGLLVEYFIIGAVASLWMAPLLLDLLLARPQFSKDLVVTAVATLVPAIYVVGMVCDYLGYKAVHRWKTKIEGKASAKYKQVDAGSQVVHAAAVLYAPDLAAQLDLRSSRDRVARGSMIASVPLLVASPFGATIWWHGTLSGVLIITVLALLWERMQRLSAEYECVVRLVLHAKFGLTISKQEGQELRVRSRRCRAK